MARILAPSSVPRIRTAWTENRDIPGVIVADYDGRCAKAKPPFRRHASLPVSSYVLTALLRWPTGPLQWSKVYYCLHTSVAWHRVKRKGPRFSRRS